MENPPEMGMKASELKHMIFDGTFIHGRKSIVVIMDGENCSVLGGQYGVQENSIPQLNLFLLPFMRQGLCPQSATVDGNPQVIKLFRAAWPHIIIQRCLVHIQRQGIMWCRQKPKRTDAKHLRKLFLKVTYIKTRKEKEDFIRDFNQWEKRFGSCIQHNSERGKVFSDIKRARSMLLKALPDMFHYLDDPKIPFSTNGLEGYFSRLKSHYRRHRGLSPKRRKNYFQWYFYLKNR